MASKTIKKISVNQEKFLNSTEYREELENNQEERKVVTLTFRRRKTGSEVRIISDYLSISPILEKFMDSKTEDDYLIPCFSAKTQNDEKKEIQCVARFFNKNKTILNDYLSKFCAIWNLDRIENLTYYQARAAFANRVAEMGVSYNLIQKMMGHKQSVLERHYIAPPTDWEQSEVSYRIFNEQTTIADLLSQRFQ